MASQRSKTSSCQQQRLCSDSVNVQIDLTLGWGHMPFCRFLVCFMSMFIHDIASFIDNKSCGMHNVQTLMTSYLLYVDER